VLSGGGSRLVAGDEVLVDEKKRSYHLLYRRFVELVRNGESDVDLSPLQLVADAFMLGRRREVEAFTWNASLHL
jgi:D-galactose 1-dehydrogenase